MMMRHEQAVTLFCHQSCPEPSTTNSLRCANTAQPKLKKSRKAFPRRPRTNSEFFGAAKRKALKAVTSQARRARVCSRPACRAAAHNARNAQQVDVHGHESSTDTHTTSPSLTTVQCSTPSQTFPQCRAVPCHPQCC